MFGPNVDNYIVRFWTKQPFQADLGNLDGPIQFVHEDDVVDALTGLLDGGHEGVFNLAGDGHIDVARDGGDSGPADPPHAASPLPRVRAARCGG